MTPRPEDTPAHLARWACHTDPCDLMMPPPVDYVRGDQIDAILSRSWPDPSLPTPDGYHGAWTDSQRQAEPPRATWGWWIVAVVSAIILGIIVWATTARAACNPLNCPPVKDIPVVPLPATALLLGGAVALLAWRARK